MGRSVTDATILLRQVGLAAGDISYTSDSGIADASAVVVGYDFDSAVQANIDISHLLLANVQPEELRRLKGKAIHVHISDCDGKVHGDLPAGMGVTPIKEYLAAIRDTGYDGTVSIELEYAPNPDEIVAWAQKAYDGTAAIMAELGVRG